MTDNFKLYLYFCWAGLKTNQDCAKFVFTIPSVVFKHHSKFNWILLVWLIGYFLVVKTYRHLDSADFKYMVWNVNLHWNYMVPF